MAGVQFLVVGVAFGGILFAVPTTGDSTTASADADNVTRVNIKDGERYIAECFPPKAQEARQRRSSEPFTNQPIMKYGIIFLEAKFIGTGNATCRESSVKNYLRTKLCVGEKQQGCAIRASDPVKECGKRPLSLVYKCGMTEWRFSDTNHGGRCNASNY
ncbi:uncharacterized protein LOC129595427 isoform X2 [Paramacrobiotus metropolitanus]|uniref:uncharacterized protein LOC129595427 isoform X2 n=1 Tax=Paramacrobiotus metropolitanus TaxID=2943436 RepID=UPI002445826D|nr:uncharacterized protein LOC129595427 isoform X2 [Paramacrobiotus metropolitanus]